ncbi:PREDICTED: putative uncharacterized protein ZNRD1-AS1 homolog [Chinchilla lanigera]|uniref:putative uncharacterized protein ZNRD1-AS1 homolog n=1 Tax=Chinchilla lanigera TaxID=34839 RepID=UPI000698D413|nr:PREDICTED: putative uncharacterized protein ZNRD1-AS1 homolog [Chinchilla lanigera]
MLYMKLAADRVMAEAKDTEDKHKATRTMRVTKEALEKGDPGGLSKELGGIQAQPSQPPAVTEWLGLSTENQLAWARNTQDPWMAAGPFSPLEKKIKSLGGIHSSEVRKLLAQQFQKEHEALDKFKAMSFDFWFAKAKEYYYQRHQEMMKEAQNKTVPEREIKVEEDEKRSQSKKSEDAKKWGYLVSERELNHIEKHIQRAERARGLRDHKYQPFPPTIPSEKLSPKTLPLETEKKGTTQKAHKPETKKHKVAWAQEQMKRHQERMIRGRKLTEQRSHQRDAWKRSGYVPPVLKSQVEKKEVKESERVTAYPIFQPYQKTLMEVTILMEKSKEATIQKPLPRELLSIPPFLRSKLEKYKVLSYFIIAFLF